MKKFTLFVALAAMLAFAAAASTARAVTIDLVTVGDPGNVGEFWTDPDGILPDATRGDVAYTYQIGKYEVTVGQYAEFLNAVARTDAYGLWDPLNAATRTRIARTGTSGSYVYTADASYVNRPVNWVTGWNAMRFANWMSNGQPTAGIQDATTTEDGSYTLNGYTDLDWATITRKPGATWVLPSEDEWYKAAYYDPNKPGGAGYWDYPTGTDALPSNDLITPDPGNNANFNQGGMTTPAGRTVVGDFENSTSHYGTFDQAGNVSEWGDTIVVVWDEGDGIGQAVRPCSGGSYWFEASDIISSHRGTWALNRASDDVGFRLAFMPAAGGDVVWTGTGGTAWSSTGNWNPGSTPNGVKNTFDDTATGLSADIASAATPTSVVFNNSSKNFTITGASGIGGTATVLKQGTGTVTMSSVNTYSGVTTVEAGKLILSGAAKAMVPVLNNGGADIKGGMLVLDYVTEADPVATVKSLLTTSYAAGAWNTGKFQSSSASSSRGLGWNDNTSTSKINIAYTVYGDTNLDGTTNFTDLSKLLSKYGQSGVWADGDANYDGTVNFTDLSKMLSTYGQSVGTLTPSPEPSSIALLLTLAGLVGAWVIRRRGR